MIENIRHHFLDLFRPWGSDAPDKQHFQLGLSALGGVILGLCVWVAFQSKENVQRAYGDIPTITIKVQNKQVASEVGADFGHKEDVAVENKMPDKPVVNAQPFQDNAVKVTADELAKPAIAFVVVDFGMSVSATQLALEKLPAKTSVIVPAGLPSQNTIDAARAKNIEVWIGLAFEPVDYPINDAGPLTIFQDADAATNRTRLAASLEGVKGAAGAAAITASPLFKSGPDMDLVAGTIFEKGFGFLSLPSPDIQALAKTKKAPLTAPDLWLDDDGSNILAQLEIAENIAEKQGYAIILLHPYANTLDAVASWAAQAPAKGFSILPVSAIAARTNP